MEPSLKPGIYRHFKGNEYQLIGISRHSETLEPLVVYKALYTSPDFGPNAIWARPLSSFTEIIERDGKTFPRFLFVRES